MSKDGEPLPPSYTSMEFPVKDGYGTVLSTHDPVAEIKRLYDDIEEYVEQLRKNQQPDALETVVDETTLPRDLRQDILAIYTLSVGVIEAYSVELLLREMVIEQYQDSTGARELFEEKMGASRLVKLLMYFGITDNGLHGELQNVIDKRNDYVHQHEETLSIRNYDTFLSEVRRCKRGTKQLAVILDGEDFRDW